MLCCNALPAKHRVKFVPDNCSCVLPRESIENIEKELIFVFVYMTLEYAFLILK